MEKGMTNSAVALIAITALVAAFSLFGPLGFEGEKSAVYSFIEKTDQKKLVMRYLADQAVTEAFADHALEQTSGGNCDALSIKGTLDSQTGTYLTTINNQPENQDCNATLVDSSLVPPEPPNTGLEQYNAAIEVKCKTGMPEERIFVEITKNYDFNKLRLDTINSNPCTVTIRDLDSETEFTQ
ncbi:MAG: hypothetical protein HY392_04145 [Candidatus Diapherotrites archaeon]|nr:hypothetical protein [Candidatus Diapherotrites archaeon]